MKKNIIITLAALVFSTVAFAQSNVTLYGTVEQTLETTTRDTNGKKSTNMDSGDSRIGVKVNEDLGNGLKAFAVIEFDVKAEGNSPMGTNGQTYLGLTSVDYGTIKAGQYRSFTGLAARNTVRRFEGRNFTATKDDILNNSVAYISPSYQGLSVGAAVITNGYNGTSADRAYIDGNEYLINYDAGNFTAALTHLRARTADGSPEAKNTFLGLSYKLNEYEVNGSYERDNDGLVSRNLWTLGGAYHLSAKNTLRVAYQSAENTHTGYILEGVHNLSKRTAVYTNYQSINGKTINPDSNTLGFGIRHHF